MKTYAMWSDKLITCLILALTCVCFAANALADDLQLPDYVPAKLSASDPKLNSVGSDAMGELVNRWVDAYQAAQPEVKVNVVSRGSATAAAALIEGTADLGPMVREMKTPEREDFLTKYGFEPTQIRTALAGVAVYVQADNPIKKLSFYELDGIYSADLARGAPQAITNWSKVGVAGALADKPIMALGLLETNYAHSFFRQQVLLQGKLLPNVTSVSSTSSIFETIAANPNAIGVGDIVNYPSTIKALEVSRTQAGPGVAPSMSNIQSGKYPLSRYLSVYVVKEPNEELNAALKDFLRFVLSKQGQQIVGDQGYIPLPAAVAIEELKKL